MLTNITEALREVKSLSKPLKRAIRISILTGNIPAFVHLDFNDISENGIYECEKKRINY